MRVLLDACVIFPTIMREVLIGLAEAGRFEPLWSDRIVEEWVRATRRLGDGAEVQARAEAATMNDRFRSASVPPAPLDSLWLPDPNDIHVLEAAISGCADVLLTKNTSDFPTRVLSNYGILRMDPDTFLLDLLEEDRPAVETVAAAVHAKAEDISGQPLRLRNLLKRSGLPRLGKALTPQSGSA